MPHNIIKPVPSKTDIGSKLFQNPNTMNENVNIHIELMYMELPSHFTIFYFLGTILIKQSFHAIF